MTFSHSTNTSNFAIFSRKLIENCKEFDKQHITAIQHLLDSKVQPEILYKLVELVATKSSEFCNDKTFGKLIFTITQFLGRYVLQVERPLKSIIEKHKSVWKIKTEKLFNTYYECSQLSQSLVRH